jgi:hypothetical protein
MLRWRIFSGAIALLVVIAGAAHAQFPAEGNPAAASRPKPPKSAFGAPPGAIPLSKSEKVWIDPKRKAVFLNGTVVLREGPPIEMLACPVGTKEHESIIAIDAKPSTVHAGLLAVKAEEGSPVQVEPKYVPASGTVVDVIIEWKDADGTKHKARGQDWVRHIRTRKALEHPWVFAGSGFWTDETSGREHYHGDSGDFICVSNFQTATLDLPVPSSQANADLLYEAFTEKIPPTGTAVRLVLVPRIPPMPDVGAKDEDDE